MSASSLWAVNDELRAISIEQFRDLLGRGITLQEASEKYGVPYITLYRWIQQGYVPVLDRQGRRLLVDEGHVAFVAMVRHIRRKHRTLGGAPLLERDEQGQWVPYLLRHPVLSRQRKRKSPSTA